MCRRRIELIGGHVAVAVVASRPLDRSGFGAVGKPPSDPGRRAPFQTESKGTEPKTG